MPQALPWIMAASSAVNLANSVRDLFTPAPQPPPMPPTLSFEEAMQRAQATLNPLFNQSLNETLRNVMNQNIRSGFFGQLPGAALSQDAASRLEAQRAASIGNLANQMVGQSIDQAMRQQALAAEFMLNNMNAQRASGAQFAQLAGALSDLAQTWPTVFNIPNLGGTLAAGQRALANSPVSSTPSGFQLQPTFGNMGLANRSTLSGIPRSFMNPYGG